MGFFMAYTAADLENVTQAVIALATGRRAVDVTIGGKRISYQQVDLDKLQALRGDIVAEIAAGNGENMFYVTTCDKGL